MDTSNKLFIAGIIWNSHDLLLAPPLTSTLWGIICFLLPLSDFKWHLWPLWLLLWKHPDAKVKIIPYILIIWYDAVASQHVIHVLFTRLTMTQSTDNLEHCFQADGFCHRMRWDTWGCWWMHSRTCMSRCFRCTNSTLFQSVLSRAAGCLFYTTCPLGWMRIRPYCCLSTSVIAIHPLTVSQCAFLRMFRFQIEIF